MLHDQSCSWAHVCYWYCVSWGRKKPMQGSKQGEMCSYYNGSGPGHLGQWFSTCLML